MARTGRPKIQIDKDQFEKLCAIMCTLDDIAGFFDCSPDTIENWSKRTYQTTFSDIYKKKSSMGKVSLRRKQYEVALGGNVSMLIWLGKQQLGQRDNLDHQVDARIEAKGEIIYKSDWGGNFEIPDDN